MHIQVKAHTNVMYVTSSLLDVAVLRHMLTYTTVTYIHIHSEP